MLLLGKAFNTALRLPRGQKRSPQAALAELLQTVSQTWNCTDAQVMFYPEELPLKRWAKRWQQRGKLYGKQKLRSHPRNVRDQAEK